MSNDSKYFDLHTDGIGYLNRIREVRPKNGSPFWACDIAALRGSIDNVDYTRFDCRVSGAKAIELVQRYQEAVNNDRKVLVGFRIGDLYPDTFTYTKGKHAGETGVSLKARLLYIRFIKVDGEYVYVAESDESQAQAPQYSETEPEPEPEAATAVTHADSAPSEVKLSKDDPDFLERKSELKEAGYRFDGQTKVWYLPETTATA